jgi:hypothetical protein
MGIWSREVSEAMVVGKTGIWSTEVREVLVVAEMGAGGSL